MKQVYVDKLCNGDNCGYVHTLMLDNYSEKCFNEINFIDIADIYLDTVKTDLPVNGITFIRPFDFQPLYDSRDLKAIRGQSIIEIYYADKNTSDSIPDISSIYLWVNGERKVLEHLNNSARQQSINHYNSKN